MGTARSLVPPRAAAIRVLGFLDDPTAQALVLPYLAPTYGNGVRAAALAALRSMPRPKGNNEALVRRLVPLLEDAEASHVIGPAIEVLQELELPESMAGELERLVRSRRPDVKRFVLARLKDFDTPGSATILLRFLEDDDLSKDPSRSFYTVFVARRRGGARRIAGHALTFAVRLGLAVRYRIPTAWRILTGRHVAPETIPPEARDW